MYSGGRLRLRHHSRVKDKSCSTLCGPQQSIQVITGSTLASLLIIIVSYTGGRLGVTSTCWLVAVPEKRVTAFGARRSAARQKRVTRPYHHDLLSIDVPRTVSLTMNHGNMFAKPQASGSRMLPLTAPGFN
ncbi:hypothetical protein PENSPDRAFT_123831 [Peniophora sp. CONT]|nr:hypothetical protein PENSPDRAFT_123831 [Peniophora sp. CONT]